MIFHQSDLIRERFHSVVPGASHTYAKGDDQFPETCAPFLVRGSGCHVWDVDGNRFIEYGMGCRAVTLGHAHPEINAAVARQLELGNNFTRPAIIELECAEALKALLPGADMVKFGKNGSDANGAAIRLARGYTGRNRVAICADHPFFSVDDWFIGTTAMNTGIPQVITDLTVKFRYNDIESLEKLFAAYPNEIACVLLEPERTEEPHDQFLHRVRDLCHQNGAVFILDEIITGFRWHIGGAQSVHKITPDLSTFGKAIGNGFSVSALAGRREIMERGGLNHDKERVWLLSLTHGAEHTCLAAAIAVMKYYQAHPVIETMWKQGERLRQGVQNCITTHNVEKYFRIAGKPCCLMFATLDRDGKPSQGFRTLFLQELIRRGVIAPSFIVSYAHSDADIDHTIEAVDQALAIYRRALEDGFERFLDGRPVKPVYRARN